MAEAKPTESRIGDWARAARASRGISQSDVAEMTGYTQEYISGIERGTRNPSRKVIEALVETLSQPGSDAKTKSAMLQEALYLRFGVENSVTREIAPEALSFAERYDGLPPVARDMLKNTMDAAERMVQEMQREGTLGRIAEDDK